jgi:PAS domain-containing protein
MEKLDAALNNMSHGLCMFGPDNRLLLWNDRYVKMYRLAPDRLHVGCTR